jgi:MFS family permease
VATLTVSGAVAVVILRKLSPERMLVLGIITLTLGVLITLAGVRFQNVNVMLFGKLVRGIGFGTVFSGALRSVLAYAQPGERAGVLSAYFVEGYLAFSVPALAAGFLAPIVGLTRTANIYGAGVILLAVSSLVVTLLRRRHVASRPAEGARNDVPIA